MKVTDPEDVQVVAPISEMDKDTFTLHLMHRHKDSMAGLQLAPGKLADAVEPAYRSFHERLHETRIDLEHEHREG